MESASYVTRDWVVSTSPRAVSGSLSKWEPSAGRSPLVPSDTTVPVTTAEGGSGGPKLLDIFTSSFIISSNSGLLS